MELDHEFTVTADADTAWPVLLDVERMHPLVPGVVYESGEDGEYRGRLKLRFGPTTITYRGTVRIAVVDDLTRTAILEVSAREARGPGTVTGSFQATVLPVDGSRSRVALHTRVEFTGGRAAALSEHLVHDTGAKLLARFSANLDALLTSPEPVPTAEPAPTEPPAEDPSSATAEPAGETPVEATTVPPQAAETPASEPDAEATPVEAAEEAAAVPSQAAEDRAPEPEAEAVSVEVAEEAAAVAAGVAESPAAEPVAVAGAVVRAAGPVERDDTLELYELNERSGWLRRLLPVAGLLALVLVVRRLARRR